MVKGDTLIKKVKQDRELWELFTKKEEYDPIILDKYGRLSYYLGSQRNVFEPEVSSFLIKNGLSPEYPEGKKFAVCLIHDITHDIDFVCPEMSKTAARTIKTLKKGQFVRASILPFSRINKTWSPLWNFRQIMELEENYGEKSTFYFRTLEYAGFSYDSTFRHHYCAGFRNGMDHPFSPYNLNTGKEIDILEIPLSVIDTTLFNQMHLDFNQAWKLTEKLIDTVEFRGVLMVLWYNIYQGNYPEGNYPEGNYPEGDYLEFYKKRFQCCAEKDGWTAS